MTGHTRRRLALLVRALLVFFGVAPFVPALTRGVPVLGVLGQGLDAWFSFHCHRDPARTLAGCAVCVRCLGIYAGLALGALFERPHLGSKHVRWLLGSAFVLVLDVASEALGLRPPLAALRFVTGFSFAYPAGVAIARALSAFEPKPLAARL
jgi:uncharacterized membrane protein